MDRDLRGEEFPIALPAKFVRADNAHRDNRIAELNCHPEDPGIELSDASVARARPFGEDDQTDAIVQGLFCQLHHPLVIRKIAFGRNGDVAEPAHHPAVGRNLEMRFVFQPAHELRDRRVDDEGVPEVYVITNEEARPIRVETRRVLHFEPDTCDPQDIAKQPALRSVVFPRIDDVTQYHQEGTDRKEMNDADDPEQDRADEIITLLQKTQRLPGAAGVIEDFRFNICHLSFVIVLQASGSMVNVKSQMENDKWNVLANSFLGTN